MGRWLRTFVLVFGSLGMTALFGCGGSGSTAPTATLTGVAAAGAPLVGTVYLKDSSVPTQEVSDPIKSDGSFNINVEGLKKPYFLKAVGISDGVNYTLFSFVSDADRANITPLSNLCVIKALGRDDLATVFNDGALAQILMLKSRIADAQLELKTLLAELIGRYADSSTDFITGQFVADHTGFDLLFDQVAIDASGGIVKIRNRSTDGVIFTSTTGNMAAGTVNVSMAAPVFLDTKMR